MSNRDYTNFIIRGKDLQSVGPVKDWSAITSSSSGQYLAACPNGSSIYYSRDYGTNWTASSSTFIATDWTGITSSSSGQYMIACQSNGYVYISSDYGATWENNGSNSQTWYGITSSSSGQYLAKCCFSGGGIYVSPDYGASWIQISLTGASKWLAITSSSSGQYLAACGTNNVSISNNYGSTWEEGTIVGSSWSLITSSDSGQYLAVCGSSVNIFISSDYGATWQQSASSPANKDWRDIKSSGSGQYLAACAYYDYIYTSSDYGANWKAITSGILGYWNCITYSSSGQYLVAGVGGGVTGYLYTYKKTIDMGEIYGSMIDELQVSQYSPPPKNYYNLNQITYNCGIISYFDLSYLVKNGLNLIILNYICEGTNSLIFTFTDGPETSTNIVPFTKTYDVNCGSHVNYSYTYFLNVTNGLKIGLNGQPYSSGSYVYLNIIINYNI